MRYAILGDIHSNLAALEAVLQDLDIRGGFDQVWCLGDVVGYGPEPHRCIELLQQYSHMCIAGNHDWAAVGSIDVSDFNPDAAQACRWTEQSMSVEDKEYLEYLPAILSRDEFTLVHGSPREPVWEYLLSVGQAVDNFKYFNTGFCLIGHSHIPLLFEQLGDTVIPQDFPDGAALTLGKNRLIINPGSVGQPRDHDPRASYVLYNSETGTVHHYRVEYDISATQVRMQQEGLPEFLIHRLSQGW
jgi:diadenosine tetraphosphatase ApaH/serine/threonine PP2A family protein phosphatase